MLRGRWALICTVAATVALVSRLQITAGSDIPTQESPARIPIPAGRGLKDSASSCPRGAPHFLVTYVSYSMHTRSLAAAIEGGLVSAGLQQGCIRVKPIPETDLHDDVLAWADAVIVGGPVERGIATHAMSSFVSSLIQLQDFYPTMKGKVACGFGTGGAVSARAEAMVGHVGQQLKNASFTLPTFADSWHFSTGLIAITGESPFCQIGQTDRFPHETGAKAVMHGCEVGDDHPPGTLHPQFVKLAEEYAGRLLNLVLEHLDLRRMSISELEDRVVLDQVHPPAKIDWGEFGENTSSPNMSLGFTGSVAVLLLATIVWQLSVRMFAVNRAPSSSAAHSKCLLA